MSSGETARDEWLAAFAQRLGLDPPDAAMVDTLLELAGVAAHASERTAAPIACYLVGRSGIDVVAALERSRQVDPALPPIEGERPRS